MAYRRLGLDIVSPRVQPRRISTTACEGHIQKRIPCHSLDEGVPSRDVYSSRRNAGRKGAFILLNDEPACATANPARTRTSRPRVAPVLRSPPPFQPGPPGSPSRQRCHPQKRSSPLFLNYRSESRRCQSSFGPAPWNASSVLIGQLGRVTLWLEALGGLLRRDVGSVGSCCQRRPGRPREPWGSGGAV